MVTAFILATTETGKERDVHEHLSGMSEVKEARSVYGDFDLVIRVETPTMEELNKFIIDKLRQTPYISMTSTMVGL